MGSGRKAKKHGPLQALATERPSVLKRSYKASMMMKVKPPPALPHPATRALARPTMGRS